MVYFHVTLPHDSPLDFLSSCLKKKKIHSRPAGLQSLGNLLPVDGTQREINRSQFVSLMFFSL